jgi:hypothetical protein
MLFQSGFYVAGSNKVQVVGVQRFVSLLLMTSKSIVAVPYERFA